VFAAHLKAEPYSLAELGGEGVFGEHPNTLFEGKGVPCVVGPGARHPTMPCSSLAWVLLTHTRTRTHTCTRSCAHSQTDAHPHCPLSTTPDCPPCLVARGQQTTSPRPWP
jgi:hypothetical protein